MSVKSVIIGKSCTRLGITNIVKDRWRNASIVLAL
jgi:hypothetical protein